MPPAAAWNYKTKPIRFELVELMDKESRKQYGWWSGDDWQITNRRIGPVIAWRYNKGESTLNMKERS